METICPLLKSPTGETGYYTQEEAKNAAPKDLQKGRPEQPSEPMGKEDRPANPFLAGYASLAFYLRHAANRLGFSIPAQQYLSRWVNLMIRSLKYAPYEIRHGKNTLGDSRRNDPRQKQWTGPGNDQP